jgi:hypothetical protein
MDIVTPLESQRRHRQRCRAQIYTSAVRLYKPDVLIWTSDKMQVSLLLSGFEEFADGEFWS